MLIEAELVGTKDNRVWFSAPLTNELKIALENAKNTVAVEVEDKRNISLQQRRKVYVLIRYISEGLGYTPQEVVKEMTKLMYNTSGLTCKTDLFSLSDCSMTTARLYIDFLIQFCIEHGIQCGEPLYKLCEDLERYTYYCLMNKVCVVCGSPKADLHHIDSVGAGRNRKDIIHLGMRCLPCCRKHHNEAHQIGRDTFLEKYAVVPLEINERIATKYKLRKG